MFDLPSVQAAVRENGCDGWLLYDFRGLNVLAARVVGTADTHLTRRWFYFVPANGTPRKLVHAIESGSLDHLPGDKTVYLKWQELEAGLKQVLGGAKRVAMEYAPRNGNPYISRADAGTVELVRSFGAEVVSSGDLIQQFEATWDDEQWASHLEAAKYTDAAYGVVWQFIAEEIRTRGYTLETAVQARIMKHFADNGLTTDHAPIIGEGPHSADPHFSPAPETDRRIQPGSFVLVDLWAKMNKPRAVYSDLTRVGFVGEDVPARINAVFHVVRDARDAGIDRVKRAFAAGEPLQGWQVDAATRDVIERAGYGPQFCHRTGHNIGQETHGNGAHMDNLETREERRVMRKTCFSIEPGIYFPGEFGVRSEIDIYIDANGGVHVTGGDLQTEVRRILV
jgi:Xaa-Pro aminopeptidase